MFRQMTRRILGIAASTVALGLAMDPLLASAQTAARPNIVLIVLDDVGFADLGSYGSEIRTPNIDALAASGVRYNRFDTKAVCSPTRAALLTGRNSHTVGMGDLPEAAPKTSSPAEAAAMMSYSGVIPLNAETVAQALQHAGYGTIAIGKWHLSPPSEDGTEGKRARWPLQQGFDQFYGFIGGHTEQWKPELVEGNGKVPTPDRPGYHLSVDLADRAIERFKTRRTAGNQSPLFMYLAFGFAHSPHHAPPEYRARYKGRYDTGWDELRRERLARQKALGIVPANTVLSRRNQGDPRWQSLTAQQKRVYARFMENYAGFIEHGDEQIGRLVSYLKESGQYENTVFVVLSDNGAAPEAGHTGGFVQSYRDTTPIAEMERRLDELGGPTTQPLYPRSWAMAGNTPFMRYKTWPFAGGPRDPLIVAWQAGIKDAGVIRSQFVDVVDIAPTLLDIAGAQFRTVIDGRDQIPVAGRSVRATFASATAATRGVQYFEFRGNRAITSGKWKAVAMHAPGTDFARDRWQLFDTASDFAEANDVSSRFPGKLRELKALWLSEATKYSSQPLKEMSPGLRSLGLYDDAFKPTSGNYR